jgi:hypothetical protein
MPTVYKGICAVYVCKFSVSEALFDSLNEPLWIFFSFFGFWTVGHEKCFQCGVTIYCRHMLYQDIPKFASVQSRDITSFNVHTWRAKWSDYREQNPITEYFNLIEIPNGWLRNAQLWGLLSLWRGCKVWKVVLLPAWQFYRNGIRLVFAHDRSTLPNAPIPNVWTRVLWALFRMRHNIKYFSPDFVSLNKPSIHILYAVSSVLMFCERNLTIVVHITSLAKTAVLYCM